MKPATLGALLVASLSIAAGEAPSAASSTPSARPERSAGCRSSVIGPGEERVTTTSGGAARAYFRHVPPGPAATPRPLVLDLHGHTEPADLHEKNTMLGPFGDEHGFVTVTPEGSGPPPHWDTRFGSADMRFLEHVLDEVERTICIDERRVFVTGFSNGAFMASAMACIDAERIAAVGVVAGIRDVPRCKPARPVPVVAFHGIADPFVAFKGGLGPGVRSLPAADRQELIDSAAPTDSGRSIPGVAAAWAARNGCAPKPQRSSVASDVTLVRYRCSNGADVRLYEIKGGGHTWPGSEFSKAIEDFVGPTTFSINADEIIWQFFRQHPLRRRG